MIELVELIPLGKVQTRGKRRWMRDDACRLRPVGPRIASASYPATFGLARQSLAFVFDD